MRVFVGVRVRVGVRVGVIVRVLVTVRVLVDVGGVPVTVAACVLVEVGFSPGPKGGTAAVALPALPVSIIVPKKSVSNNTYCR